MNFEGICNKQKFNQAHFPRVLLASKFYSLFLSSRCQISPYQRTFDSYGEETRVIWCLESLLCVSCLKNCHQIKDNQGISYSHLLLILAPSKVAQFCFVSGSTMLILLLFDEHHASNVGGVLINGELIKIQLDKRTQKNQSLPCCRFLKAFVFALFENYVRRFNFN